MVKAIFQSARNMHAKIKNIEIVANNLANISTTGFKRQLPFSELVNRFDDNKYKQVTDFTQGGFNTTGNPLDLAIQGKGFFTVENEKGVELTRNGKFSISNDGYIVNQEGAKLMGEGGPINLGDVKMDKASEVKISASGDVTVDGKLKARIRVSSVDDQLKMERAPFAAFTTEQGTTKNADTQSYSIMQGYLEDSNINPILEMQSMITLSKDFEASQKLINNYDQQLSRMNEIGRV